MLRACRDLDLSGCGLKALPEQTAELGALETLRLGNNALEALPPQLGACPALVSGPVWDPAAAFGKAASVVAQRYVLLCAGAAGRELQPPAGPTPHAGPAAAHPAHRLQEQLPDPRATLPRPHGAERV